MGAAHGFSKEVFACPELCPSFQASNDTNVYWLPCLATDTAVVKFKAESLGRGPIRRRRAKDRAEEICSEEAGIQRLEELTRELFNLHDLNGNSLLEESELVTLNERIALLHHGQDADTEQVRAKYKALFRTKLDPMGRPVPYSIFRGYALSVLEGLDNDPEAQEMILEQFVAEAQAGRQALELEVGAGLMTPNPGSPRQLDGSALAGGQDWELRSAEDTAANMTPTPKMAAPDLLEPTPTPPTERSIVDLVKAEPFMRQGLEFARRVDAHEWQLDRATEDPNCQVCLMDDPVYSVGSKDAFEEYDFANDNTWVQYRGFAHAPMPILAGL